MRPAAFVARSLRHYWRTHLGVLAAAAVTSAVLVGALSLGDCVRHSLRELALLRLGEVDLALVGGDRFFRAALAEEISVDLAARAAPVVSLPCSAVNVDANVRVGGVEVLGVDERFWALGGEGPLPLDADEAAVSVNLARRLGISLGQTLLLRVAKPSAISRDAPMSATSDASAAIRLTVAAVVSDADFGRFSLRADQVAPLNVFVPRAVLAKATGLAGRANLLLVDLPGDQCEPGSAQQSLATHMD